MITEDQIIDAFSNTANDHDPTKAVRALLGQAWEEGWAQGWNAGNAAASDAMTISTPNPYEED